MKVSLFANSKNFPDKQESVFTPIASDKLVNGLCLQDIRYNHHCFSMLPNCSLKPVRQMAVFICNYSGFGYFFYDFFRFLLSDNRGGGLSSDTVRVFFSSVGGLTLTDLAGVFLSS